MNRRKESVEFSDRGPYHLDEIADILAAGLMRVRTRQSTAQSADFRESSLDCPADQSGHADVLNGGRK